MRSYVGLRRNNALIKPFWRTWLVLGIAASCALTGQVARAQDSAIAYVAPSRENTEIRLINGDGTNDRRIWAIAGEVAPFDGIGTLSWRPDGGELAFDSGHQWSASMAIRDLYAIRPDGSGGRRLTNAPAFGALGAYPQGSVTVSVRVGGSKDLIFYVEGASEPLRILARGSGVHTVTFPSVADFGPGVRQKVRIFDLSPGFSQQRCFFDIGVFADVIVGQTVDAGVMPTVFNDAPCWQPRSPAWQLDGSKIIYLTREPTQDLLRQDDVHIWSVAANPPILDVGERVLDYTYDTARSPLVYAVEMTTNASIGDEMLLAEGEADFDYITAARVDTPRDRTQLDGPCDGFACLILGVAWMPDGVGFVYSRYETRNGQPDIAYVYLFDVATGDSRELFFVEGAAIGGLTVSPDGQQIAFARADGLVEGTERYVTGPRLLCPCEIWTATVDGSNLQRIVADGRAPAWSPSAVAGPPPDLIFDATFEAP